MTQVFSTRYACIDDSGKTVLKTLEQGMRPGQSLSFPPEDNILIAGGFPSLTPESGPPLSPALQLMADLTPATENELIRVAEAELSRLQSCSSNSYEIEIDPRVCVIADSATALDTFMDTYGGILEIQPLLIKKSHSRYATITDYSVERKGGQCLLRYRQRSPLKAELCTYCGICGKVCAEKCISPQLTIDFTRCTFCKECEQQCPAGALDIHGLEEFTSEVPALIVLGDISSEIPENIDCVYRENEIMKYLATLASYTVEEVVCHNNTICQYSGRLNMGCRRCIGKCPENAIVSGTNGITVDHLRCTGCGSCIASCPTGAMQLASFDDKALLEYLQALDLPEGCELVIGQEKSLNLLWWQNTPAHEVRRYFLEYGSIHSLSLMHFLLLFATGFSRVVLLQEQEGNLESAVNEQARLANSIVSSLFGQDNFIQLIPSGSYDLSQGESGPAASIQTIWQTTGEYINRQKSLSQILAHLLSVSGKELQLESIEHTFVNLNCDADACTLCLACLNECKTGALQSDRENFILTFEAPLCVGCTTCQQVCPESVLSMVPAESLNTTFLLKKTLAQTEPAKCKRCGEIFGTRKSLDRVMNILSAREAVNMEHFEYCSDCRVINLFEAQQHDG